MEVVVAGVGLFSNPDKYICGVDLDRHREPYHFCVQLHLVTSWLQPSIPHSHMAVLCPKSGTSHPI